MAVFKFRAHPNRPPLPFGQVEFVQGLHQVKQVGFGSTGWFDPAFAIGCQDKAILCRTANAQSFWLLYFIEMGGEDGTAGKIVSDFEILIRQSGQVPGDNSRPTMMCLP